MKNIALKNSVYLLIAISSIVWYLLAKYSNLNLTLAKEFFGLVPKVVSIDMLLILIFAKWGWRLRIFKTWLVPFPDLNGSWVGNIFSDWIDPKTGAGVPPIPVMLTVRQTFFHISFVMHTGEMKSHSVSEGFTIDKDKQINLVSYIYTSKPRIVLNQRSLPHDGAVIFEILESPNKKLNGRYWTERKTKGEINLVYLSKNILNEIPKSAGNHPITETENRRD